MAGWPAGRVAVWPGVAVWPCDRVTVWPWSGGRGRVAGWQWPGLWPWPGRGRDGRQLKKAIVWHFVRCAEN